MQFPMSSNLFLGILIQCCLQHIATSINPDYKDLVLTVREKKLLNTFKSMVEPYIPGESSYMNSDIYLVRWLRATRFDVQKAEQKFFEDMSWRDENSINSLMYEDFSDLQMDFSVNQTDDHGRPVLYMPLETWNVRQQIIAGKGNRFERYVYKMLELASQRVRDLQAEGKQVTRFTVISNLKGFTIQEHGCLRCIPIYLILTQAFERHYPESLAKCSFVNTPSIFEFVLTALKSVMSEELKSLLEVHGTNQQLWPSNLRSLVNKIDKELYPDQD